MAAKIADRDPDEEIAKAFALFDESGRGRISARDLKRVARELGEALADEEIQEMIDEADRDGDGEVDLEEFRRVRACVRRTSVPARRMACVMARARGFFFCPRDKESRARARARRARSFARLPRHARPTTPTPTHPHTHAHTHAHTQQIMKKTALF
jgi:hypothetical protein